MVEYRRDNIRKLLGPCFQEPKGPIQDEIDQKRHIKSISRHVARDAMDRKPSHERVTVKFRDRESITSGSRRYGIIKNEKEPTCKYKQVLLYLFVILLARSYSSEPNPGPRQPKYPCGVCMKTCKWTTPCVCCDMWYHQECMGKPSSQRHTLPNQEYIHSNSEVIILNNDQHQHQKIISTNNRIN